MPLSESTCPVLQEEQPFLEALSPATPDVGQLWEDYNPSETGGEGEDRLIRYYLPLVKSVVHRIAMSLPSHVSVDDLQSAGLVGLLDAVRRFDRESGTIFETYARVRIRGAVFDELRRLDWVPRSVHDKARKVEAIVRELEQKTGRAPSDVEMARALNLSLEEYENLLEEIKPVTFVCLDSMRFAEEDDGNPRYESLADDKQVDPSESAGANEMAQLVIERLDRLPEMQRKVLALYYFEDLRLRDIADRFKVTESRICQIHAQAIQTLKSYVRRQCASELS